MIIRDITQERITDARVVELIGPVERGDFVQFLRAVEGIEHAFIFVSGPGGDLDEALSIGSEIWERGFSTAVPSAAQCASACAYIWLSGVIRWMPDKAQIEFHAASASRDEKSAMALADLGSYLTFLGLKREAIKYLSSAPSYDVRRLTLEDAAQLEIEVRPLKLEEGFLPPAPPTPGSSINPGEIAQLASLVVTFYGQCGNAHDVDHDAIRAYHKNLMDAGKALAGDEVFGEMLSVELGRRIHEIRSETHEHWCRRTRAMFAKPPFREMFGLID